MCNNNLVKCQKCSSNRKSLHVYVFWDTVVWAFNSNQCCQSNKIFKCLYLENHMLTFGESHTVRKFISYGIYSKMTKSRFSQKDPEEPFSHGWSQTFMRLGNESQSWDLNKCYQCLLKRNCSLLITHWTAWLASLVGSSPVTIYVSSSYGNREPQTLE